MVAAGSRIKGEISGAADILIHGQVEGQLALSGDVVIAEGGVVKGRIEARRTRVSGKVFGDIHASERIEVLASGAIEGDVIAPRVAINAGAFFKGKVEMTAQGKMPAAAPAAPQPSKPAASESSKPAAAGSKPAVPAPAAKPQ